MNDLRLTPKQLSILRFIQDYCDERGMAPTLDEIAEHCGVNKVTIHGHLVELQKKGAVQREPRMARSIRVVQAPPEAKRQRNADARASDPSSGNARREASRTLVPIAGAIAAGQPIEALEREEMFDLSELLPEGRDMYLLEVQGDSMIEDQIKDGDLVLVERRNTARNGEIVVAVVEGNEATLKRFYREKDRVRLQPSNAKLQPIYADHVEIRGVVSAVIRRIQ
ncbi:MAG: transcriptional repressor LexA [Planctomycetes bacterium]|nr:transcriptional repressor LexA [Planctomycetota bacterium]